MIQPSIPFPTLLTHLADPDPLVRLQTIKAIMSQRSQRAGAVPALLPLLSDPDRQVCHATLVALGKLADPRAIPALLPLTSHAHSQIRRRAIIVLADLDRVQATPHVYAALSD